MPHASLAPMFLGLRVGLHVLFLALVALVVGRSLVLARPATPFVVIVSAVLVVTYLAGVFVARLRTHRYLVGVLWAAVLTGEWALLLWFTPEAAYLVFPLFFLYLHVLKRRWGSLAIVLTTLIAIWALAAHDGWTVGGVVGPLVGAGVALLLGLGYQALAQEAHERDQLMQQLLATQNRLAVTERETGVLTERARLAREIHDTLAQGLSSIQILLHAAERADPQSPGLKHVQLARSTAAENLADARRFIRELTPPDLENQGVVGALRRLAQEQWEPRGLRVQICAPDSLDLPMHVQTALLRIAQGAIANVFQHAHTDRATIRLSEEGSHLLFVVEDHGRGFSPDIVRGRHQSRSDSFGLQATRERVEQLGGTLTVRSQPGQGTTLEVRLAMGDIS